VISALGMLEGVEGKVFDGWERGIHVDWRWHEGIKW
jgi:hypothetical protein